MSTSCSGWLSGPNSVSSILFLNLNSSSSNILPVVAVGAGALERSIPIPMPKLGRFKLGKSISGVLKGDCISYKPSSSLVSSLLAAVSAADRNSPVGCITASSNADKPCLANVSAADSPLPISFVTGCIVLSTSLKPFLTAVSKSDRSSPTFFATSSSIPKSTLGNSKSRPSGVGMFKPPPSLIYVPKP